MLYLSWVFMGAPQQNFFPKFGISHDWLSCSVLSTCLCTHALLNHHLGWYIIVIKVCLLRCLTRRQKSQCVSIKHPPQRERLGSHHSSHPIKGFINTWINALKRIRQTKCVANCTHSPPIVVFPSEIVLSRNSGQMENRAEKWRRENQKKQGSWNPLICTENRGFLVLKTGKTQNKCSCFFP